MCSDLICSRVRGDQFTTPEGKTIQLTDMNRVIPGRSSFENLLACLGAKYYYLDIKNVRIFYRKTDSRIYEFRID